MDNIFLPKKKFKEKKKKKCGLPTGFKNGHPLDRKQKFFLGWPQRGILHRTVAVAVPDTHLFVRGITRLICSQSTFTVGGGGGGGGAVDTLTPGLMSLSPCLWMIPSCNHPLDRVPTAQAKQGKWQKKSLSGKTQGIWKFCQNTGNFVCSSCKFPDAKGNGTAIFAAEISIFFWKLDRSAKSVLCI